MAAVGPDTADVEAERHCSACFTGLYPVGIAVHAESGHGDGGLVKLRLAKV